MNVETEDIKMLEEIRLSYVRQADNIKNWQTMDKNKLANLYLEYENVEPERSYYFSALMCRYWSNVYKLYRSSKSTRLEISDFTSWLAESFFVAFKYRKWKDPKNPLFHDPQAPDKVINRCIYSTRMRHYQHYNMDKRRLNFQTDSIERQIESFGPLANVYNYLGELDKNDYTDVNKEIMNYYLSKNNIFTLIILDLICFDDTFRKVERIYKSTDGKILDDFEDEKDDDVNLDDVNDSRIDNFEDVNSEDNETMNFEETDNITPRVFYDFEFSMRKLMTSLRNIDKIYINYFMNRYKVKESELVNTIKKIKDLSDEKTLPSVVNKILASIARDRTVNKILCL